jgi:flagellar biogenesis protein FliO
MLACINILRLGILSAAVLISLLCAPFVSPASANEASVKNQESLSADQETTKDKPLFKKRDSSKSVGSSLPSFSSLASDMFKGLIYCGAAIFIFVSLLKKFTKQPTGEQSNPISIISKKSLNSKIALLVVEAEGQKFLLSQSAEDVKLLSTIEQSFDFSASLLSEEAETFQNKTTKITKSAVS